jgi:RimJ/RimL family protein N-acetyltransferase
VEEVAVIRTQHLSLVALDQQTLAAMAGRASPPLPFRWPAWWPDENDRDHVALWLERAGCDGAANQWGPRAVVKGREMIGHAGFHRPPQPIAAALSDPTFDGVREPADQGVVEVGYTIFPEWRRRGFASEAVRALVDWAWTTGEVGAVLASVAEANAPSSGVLTAVGGFRAIGRCRDRDGTVEVVYRCDAHSHHG